MRSTLLLFFQHALTGFVFAAFLSVDTELSAGDTWVNGQTAKFVWGQADFTSGNANRGGAAAENTLNLPGSIAVDPTSGKVFVNDKWNNRILRFASLAALKAGSPPESVLGQPNYTLTTGGTTRSKFLRPEGIFVDSTGTLWVADYTNHRVLRFDNVSSKSIGANADGVLGPDDYTTVNPALSQSDLKFPYAVAVDGSGTLWVADRGNNRVLRYDNAAGKANGANADGVLGQIDFVSDATAVSATSMDSPEGLWVGSDGSLWVSDTDNNRILRFENPSSKADGASADGVLGQFGFTTNSHGVTSFQLNAPSGLMIDVSGDLWVADTDHSRVLRYDNIAGKGDGAPADTVLGQADFETNVFSAPSASTLQGPGYVYSSGTELFVSDSGNSRFLTYTKPASVSDPDPGPSAATITLRNSLLSKIKKTKRKIRLAKRKKQKSKVKRLKKKLKRFQKRLRAL